MSAVRSATTVHEMAWAYAAGKFPWLVTRRILTPAPTDTSGFDAWLAGDLLVAVTCESIEPSDAWSSPQDVRHRVEWTADGQIRLLDHAWSGPLEDVLAGVNLLAAYGQQQIPGCLYAWAALAEVTSPVEMLSKNRHGIDAYSEMTLLRVARAWAKSGLALTAKEREILLDRRVSPDRWQPWRDAGVSAQDAEPFLRYDRATVEFALPWLRAGLTSECAAQSSSFGWTPYSVDMADWAQVGLDGLLGREWMCTALSPHVCSRLRALGAQASDVCSARYQGVPVETMLAVLEAGADPAFLHGYPPEWPSEKVLAWLPTGMRHWVLRKTLEAKPDVTPEEVLGWQSGDRLPPYLETFLLRVEDSRDRGALIAAWKYPKPWRRAS